MTTGAYDKTQDVGSQDAPRGLHALSRNTAWHLFIGLVSFASLLPFLAVPFTQHVIPDTMTAIYLFAAINFIGASFHVAATGWFYTDRTMLGFFASRPLRYFVVPCLLVLGSAAVMQFVEPAITDYLIAVFVAWQLWHYQKQNVGLLSFVAAGSDGVSVSPWERRTLGLAAIAGIAGYYGVFHDGLPNLSAEFARLHQVGAALYLLVPIAFCIALVRSPALRANPLRLAFFSFGALFFLPTFLFADGISAILGYALAHGLQYVVFMGFVSVGKKRPLISFAVLLAIATLGALILGKAMLGRQSSFAYGPAVLGVFFGATMAHFVVDAGIWRLRESFQRNYMRAKFHFVFGR